MNINSSNQAGLRGFSLVELLVVILVIGIIAGVAVPMIGNITENADDSAAKRNAQQLASLYYAADQAGATFPVTTPVGISNSLIDGVSGTYIPGSFFQAALSDEDRDAALAHLAFADGLVYTPDGGIGGSGGDLGGGASFDLGGLTPGFLGVADSIALVQFMESVNTDPALEEPMEEFLVALAFSSLPEGSTEHADLVDAYQNYYLPLKAQYESGTETLEEFEAGQEWFYNKRDAILANAVDAGNNGDFTIPDDEISGEFMDAVNAAFPDEEMVYNNDGAGNNRFLLVE